MATQNAIDTNKPIGVDDGGTGAATLTDHGVLVGSGTGAVTPLAVGATGETIMGSTGADPTWTGSPSFSGSVTAGTGLSVTTGDAAVVAGNVTLPTTTSSSGQITINSARWAHAYGTSNVFIGSGAGNFTLSGANYNCAVGDGCLSSLTSGDENVGFGYNVMGNVDSGSYNCAFAQGALAALTIGTRNIAFGRNALVSLTTGNRNVAIGYEAGKNYTTTEDSNLMLYNNGVVGESHVIRIGAQGSGNYQQDTCYIAGCYNVTPGGTIHVGLVDSNGQFGSEAQLAVARGGTGAATLTDHGVLFGSGTGAITASAALTDGQLVIGNTGSDPSLATLTAGTNITVTNGSGTITVSSTATTLNTQTGTSYQFVLTDAGKTVTLNNAGAITMTVPPNSSVAFPTGTVITIAQLGAGTVTVAEGSGVTVNSVDGNLDLSGQYAMATLTKYDTDTWIMAGSLG